MQSLTNTEVETLVARGAGVLLGDGFFATRAAHYEWDTESHLWTCLQDGLRISHCTTGERQGRRWNQARRQFVPCTCKKCTENAENTENTEEIRLCLLGNLPC